MAEWSTPDFMDNMNNMNNMDCGSLLPLFRGSPAAAEVSRTLKKPLGCRQRESAMAKQRLGAFDGQQAGLPKAAAGCRSPCVEGKRTAKGPQGLVEWLERQGEVELGGFELLIHARAPAQHKSVDELQMTGVLGGAPLCDFGACKPQYLQNDDWCQ